ncbi:MAG TPA: methyltransferase domain-containing protein, partial [Rhodospirillales bacterium]|nr:methyltransferase domain-containing protein [Rhodospirillales bacterium]
MTFPSDTQAQADATRLDDAVRSTLAADTVHDEWIAGYEGGLNDAFYEMAIDKIVGFLAPPAGATILDAGCGDGSKSIRLAKRGLQVVAIDYSQVALDRAFGKIAGSGVGDRITR